MPGMSYEEKEIVLQEGDSALLYTDGLVEAHDPQREMFGFPRAYRRSCPSTVRRRGHWRRHY